MSTASVRPCVLCISGHDPSGGAGIQADIETCAALGAHALSVISAHTVQDTHDVQRVSAVAPILIAAQLSALIADAAPRAAKIGLLGDAAQIEVIAQQLRPLAIPTVMDPVLRAGGGRALVSTQLEAAMIDGLFPIVELLTPNAREARRLARENDLQRCGTALRDLGARNVLITGGDEPGERVVDWLFTARGDAIRLESARLPETFHGAGCTLASAIAAELALGRALVEAVERGRAFVDQALRRAFAVGTGRRIPRRPQP
ncbi:MAG TPA: bifunctional hydroxymethylpyrimidine kinase/phosphomethylpyrimidine kinase [Nevskiaceae bacterium]|nr:bifunctional hydroxymethylpyrimidine kinase/phosphomethylpyrimidine kinase [Nevskiaceae bacterium]